MTVAEAIQTLSDLRDEKEHELSVKECHAIGIALIVLVALEDPKVTMVDKLIAMTDNPSN